MKGKGTVYNERGHNIQCLYCKEWGHIARFCSKKMSIEEPKEVRCFGCGETGHMARQCTKIRRDYEGAPKVYCSNRAKWGKKREGHENKKERGTCECSTRKHGYDEAIERERRYRGTESIAVGQNSEVQAEVTLGERAKSATTLVDSGSAMKKLRGQIMEEERTIEMLVERKKELQCEIQQLLEVVSKRKETTIMGDECEEEESQSWEHAKLGKQCGV